MYAYVGFHVPFFVICVGELTYKLPASFAKPSVSESRFVTIAFATPVKELFSTKTCAPMRELTPETPPL